MKTASKKCNTCHKTKPLHDFQINRGKYPLNRCRDCNLQIGRDKWLKKRLGNPILSSHKIILLLLERPRTRKQLHKLLNIRKDWLDSLIRQMEDKGYVKTMGRDMPIHALVESEEKFLLLWQDRRTMECRKHHARYMGGPIYHLNKFLQKAF